MKFTVCRTGAAAFAAALFVFLAPPVSHAQAPDSLILQAPLNVKAWSVYKAQSKDFLVWITWDDNSDAVSTFVSSADTTGWNVTSPQAQMTFPTVTGPYTGDIDRTLGVHATKSGVLGTDVLTVTYEIEREEFYSGRIDIDGSYVPGTPIPMTFRDQRNNAPIDFGLKISFSAGRMDALGSFIVGLEDFEGFHIWRGTERDGSDLQIIGEISKEEAFKGNSTGGSLADSVYFYDIVPTLRTSSGWISPGALKGAPAAALESLESFECLGTRIDIDLNPAEFFWFDCSGTNGFTYYYAVTAFDRGYSEQSGAQGLSKSDNCAVSEGTPYPCAPQLKTVALEVDAQSDLYNVYVVPNPVRTGSSRLTTDNYHNFADGLVRFVNVPPNCTIKIFTVAGDLVWANDHTDGSGNVEWDTRNYSEEEVTSGVYVYRIESSSDSVFGRIVVIR